MKLPGVPFYQANINNYTPGRVRPIRKLTIHHSAGWENTLRYLWADPNRNGSSTFWVGNQPNQIEQYLDTNDTPWTNANLASNQESITVETRGDWRGYYDRQTLDNLYTLMLKLLPHYPQLIVEYHMDVSRTFTLCPADLKHKGYAKAEWDRAVAAFNAPAPTPTPTPPAPVAINYRSITPKRVKLIRAANLWNFNFTEWAKAQAVQAYPAGHLVDVVAVAKNSLGGEYYMTAYSYNGGAVRATNGFNVVDCEDYVPAITQPPTVEQKWEPMANPRKMRLAVASYVTDLDTMKPTGDELAVGTDIELTELKTTSPGVTYARSKWSMQNNKNWGILLNRFTEVPTPEPTPEPPREPVPEPPLDVDPTVPGNSDINGQVNWLVKAIKALLAYFKIKV